MALSLSVKEQTTNSLTIKITGLSSDYGLQAKEGKERRKVQWAKSTDGKNFEFWANSADDNNDGIPDNEIPPKVTEFSQTITGLSPDTTYYIFAEIYDIVVSPSATTSVTVFEDNPLECKTLATGGSGGSDEGDAAYIPNIETFKASISEDGSITVSFKVSNLIGNTYWDEKTQRESEVILYCNGKSIKSWSEEDAGSINKSYTFSPINSDVYEIYICAYNNKYDDEGIIGYGKITSDTIILDNLYSIEPFVWTFAGLNSSFSPVAGETKGENGAIYFYLTAKEWNGFTKRINAVRAVKAYSEYDFTEAESSGITGRNVATDADNLKPNQKVSADIVNEAVEAINEMLSSDKQIDTVMSNNPSYKVTAAFFNSLKDALNSLIKQ